MFGKKSKQETDICSSCDKPVKSGQKVCGCGAATRFMDFTERTQYEVEQWRARREVRAS